MNRKLVQMVHAHGYWPAGTGPGALSCAGLKSWLCTHRAAVSAAAAAAATALILTRR